MYQDRNQRDFARKLRNHLTDAEKNLWQALRCQQLGNYKFRRQAAIGKYIVDFVCFDIQLVVEVDGGQHNEPAVREYDEDRTAWLESQGFRVLRFWNHDVLQDLETVVEGIAFVIEELTTGKDD